MLPHVPVRHGDVSPGVEQEVDEAPVLPGHANVQRCAEQRQQVEGAFVLREELGHVVVAVSTGTYERVLYSQSDLTLDNLIVVIVKSRYIYIHYLLSILTWQPKCILMNHNV